MEPNHVGVGRHSGPDAPGVADSTFVDAEKHHMRFVVTLGRRTWRSCKLGLHNEDDTKADEISVIGGFTRGQMMSH